MDATGFQRRRRALAQKQAEQEAKELEEQQQQTEDPPVVIPPVIDPPAYDENPDGHPELTAEDVDKMDIDELRSALDQLEIVYPRNTGEAKLRERLRDGIK